MNDADSSKTGGKRLRVKDCTRCGKTFETTTKTMTICKLCNTTRVKNQALRTKMWRRAKMRAKKRGQPFDIEKSDILIPDICPIMNVPIYEHKGRSGAYKYSPSLDRIDNDKGYVKGNVWVISQVANQMKGNATPEELIHFAKWVLSTYSGME
jgi:DNA-directed RNA polymerase subunit RPC12/RpoP